MLYEVITSRCSLLFPDYSTTVKAHAVPADWRSVSALATTVRAVAGTPLPPCVRSRAYRGIGFCRFADR